MIRIVTAMTAIAILASPAFATFTVYQGNSTQHPLGTFDTLHEARVFARQHHGLGESIVNDKTGNQVKSPGRVVHGNGGIKHSN